MVTPAQWSDGAGAVAVSDEWDACDPSGACHTVGRGGDYTIATSDVGETIEVAESAAAPDGTAYADSAPTAPVAYQAPVADAARPPSVTGAPQAGLTVTESHGGWSPDPTGYAYQWLDCDATGGGCSAIPGATAASYEIPESEVGSRLRVEELADYHSSQSAPSQSAPTAVVQGDSHVQLAVSTAGATVGLPVTLTATVSSDATGVSPAGTVTFTDSGAPIAACNATPVAAAGQSASASCTAVLAAPQALLGAAFTPSSGSLLTGSTSPTATLPVTRAVPSVQLTAPSRASAAARIRYTVAIFSPPGAPDPDAAVAFLDRGRLIAGCARRPLQGLVATCRAVWPVPGAHRITARYLGDAQLAPATSAMVSERITPALIRGRVAATMSWTFYFTPTYTRVVGLALAGLPAGGSVEVDCRGSGCPFAIRRWRPAGQRLDLIRALARHRLGPGARLTVLIEHRGYVGKYYSFRVRQRASPGVRIACLAPGSSLPGVACTLRTSTPAATLVHRTRRGPRAPAERTGGGAAIASTAGVVSVSGR